MENIFKPRKFNPTWDSLLTPKQKEVLTAQGLGLWHELPYLDAKDVKEIMDKISKCLLEVEELVKQKI